MNSETVKHQEENIGEKASWNRGLGKNFLDRILEAQATKTKNRQIGLYHAYAKVFKIMEMQTETTL